MPFPTWPALCFLSLSSPFQLDLKWTIWIVISSLASKELISSVPWPPEQMDSTKIWIFNVHSQGSTAVKWWDFTKWWLGQDPCLTWGVPLGDSSPQRVVSNTWVFLTDTIYFLTCHAILLPLLWDFQQSTKSWLSGLAASKTVNSINCFLYEVICLRYVVIVRKGWLIRAVPISIVRE